MRRPPGRRGGIAALILALLAPASLSAAPLPRDAGALNVRDFGAVGDGVHDDTAALLKAIAAAGTDTGTRFWRTRPVYLPDGTYRVSQTLERRYANGGFASGMILLGQSERGTVIRLADDAPGFGDPEDPRPVVMTTSKLIDRAGNKDYAGKGEGNDAYDNFLQDLTVDVGRGNPGAVGIDYLANNIGAIRNVTVTAQPGSGNIGISMRRKWPGPALLERVTVRGFGIGIAVAQTEYGITLDHVRLAGQRRAGLVNRGNVVAASDLVVQDAPESLSNLSAGGLVVLRGGAVSGRVVGGGPVTLLGVVLGGGTPQWGVLRDSRLHPRQPATFPAPLPDPPAPPEDPPERWADVLKFRNPGAPEADITDALRRAIASGAGTIYIPYGAWAIHDRIMIPPSLHRIVAVNASLSVSPARAPDFGRDIGEFFVAEPGPPLFIEGVVFDQTDIGGQLALTLAAQRTLVLQDIVTAGAKLLDRRAEGGAVFIADTCCGPLGDIAGTAPVYARQLDTEWGTPRIRNAGAPLTILGLKTENPGPVVESLDGAQTSILGGLLYPVGPADPAQAAFVLHGGARLAAAFAEEAFRSGNRYTLYVAGNTTVPAAGFPPRGLGRVVPWLSAD